MDLGELAVPEPPMFYQADPEEIDHFLDLASDAKREVTEDPVSTPDSTPTEATPSLVGAWSGTYTHQRNQQSVGLLSFSITEQGAYGSLRGSGIDAGGAFMVDGTIEDGKVDFTKSYTATVSACRYIGTLDMETGTIVGRWGPPEMGAEAAPASTMEGGTLFKSPENTKGDNSDGQLPAEQDLPCAIEITGVGPKPSKETAEEARGHDDEVKGDDAVPQAGSVREGADVTEGGCFSLIRRPVDYFLYRPSDAEFQESRPKALWQMVRNAAAHWYRSCNLIWDVLRDRRNQRNRFMELFLKQEYEGKFYDPNDAAEWETILRRTHPNDSRLWRAITRYKQCRMINHGYVYHIDSRLLLKNGLHVGHLGVMCATVAIRILTGVACCAATVLKEGGPAVSISVRIAGHRRVHERKMTSSISQHTLCFKSGNSFLGRRLVVGSNEPTGFSITPKSSGLPE